MTLNYRVIGRLYFSLLILLSVLPFKTSRVDNLWVLSWRGDYWVHMLQFIFYVTIFSKTRKLSVSLAFGVIVAVFTEGVQYWLPYRAFNINDLMANELGVILGFVLVILGGFLKTHFVFFQKAK